MKYVGSTWLNRVHNVETHNMNQYALNPNNL